MQIFSVSNCDVKISRFAVKVLGEERKMYYNNAAVGWPPVRCGACSSCWSCNLCVLSLPSIFSPLGTMELDYVSIFLNLPRRGEVK